MRGSSSGLFFDAMLFQVKFNVSLCVCFAEDVRYLVAIFKGAVTLDKPLTREILCSLYIHYTHCQLNRREKPTRNVLMHAYPAPNGLFPDSILFITKTSLEHSPCPAGSWDKDVVSSSSNFLCSCASISERFHQEFSKGE